MTAPLRIRVLPLPDGSLPPRIAGKFLQVRLDGEEWLVFAPRQRHRFHNQLLAELLAERGTPYRWEGGGTVLAFEDEGVEVVGGGRFEADTEARTLVLWDESAAYGRFDAEGLAERIAAATHPWSRLHVTIR